MHKMRNLTKRKSIDSKKDYYLTPSLLKKIVIDTVLDMLDNIMEMDSTDVFHPLNSKESRSFSL